MPPPLWRVVHPPLPTLQWNARAQLTTWNPVRGVPAAPRPCPCVVGIPARLPPPQTPKGATSVPGGPIDYASKHWSGLIADYYKARLDGYVGERGS